MTAPSPWIAGLTSRCPRCGEGALFAGYLRFNESCASCRADFRMADPGDGPAFFVMFAVGAIATPLLFILQFAFKLSPWVAVAITVAAAIALVLALLPVFKAMLFVLQWKNKASQARNTDLASGEG